MIAQSNIIENGEGSQSPTLNEQNEDEISSIFEWCRSELERLSNIISNIQGQKKTTIQVTASKLEGKIPTETIAMSIVAQLRGRVSERFIHKCLDDKYKQKYRIENAKQQKRKPTLAALLPLEKSTTRSAGESSRPSVGEPITSIKKEGKQRIEFKLKKEQMKAVKDALQYSDEYCNVIVDIDGSNGSLVGIKPDNMQTHLSRYLSDKHSFITKE